MFCIFITFFEAWMVASEVETNSDLAWTQLAQKFGVDNIIYFKHYIF
jgi:hypothetical protein